MLGVQAPVEVECGLRVGASLHVDPEEALGCCRGSRQPLEVVVGRLRIDVESQLRGLDRNLRVEATVDQRREHGLVMLNYGTRLGKVLDVFTKACEQRPDSLCLEGRRSLPRG